MDISIPYYEDKTRISNSAIGWFLKKGPAYLHKMLTEDVPEEKSQALERGTMIHSYLLTPEEFNKEYVVWDKEKPVSAQQEKFCQELANSLEIEPNRAILSAYKEAYSTKGKSEENMLSEGLKIASTLNDYITFLKSNDERKMISHWDMQMLKTIKQNIRSHKKANTLLREQMIQTDVIKIEDDGTLVESVTHRIAHEFHINWEFYYDKDKSVKCKSLLDSLELDFVNKKAIILDLKTTQKLWSFEESMQQYDYLRQLMFYKQAIMWYLEHELKEDPVDWEFEYYIIAIDTTGTYDIRTFKIEENVVRSRWDIIFDSLIDIYWHYKNDKWDHSRNYYEGDGSEFLNL